MTFRLFPKTAPRIAATGDMLSLIENLDWSKTALGPIETWPNAFVVITRTMLVSDMPMVMLMGATGVLIYNDAYASFAGPKHPEILGMDFDKAWPEIAAYNFEIFQTVLRGETVIKKSQLLQLNRAGTLEDVWLDLEYTPVIGDDGLPVGELVVFFETTGRIKAETALVKSEESLAMALTISQVVGLLDWDVVNNILITDSNYARMVGVDPEIARAGAPFETYMHAVHDDDRAAFKSAVKAALKTGEELRQEYRVRQPDGSATWVMGLGRPVYDNLGRAVRLPGIAVDITPQKTQEAALKESEAKFRAIANTLPQMLWSTLPDGFHDYYNARWYDFTGVPEGSTDGEEWNGVFHPDDQERAWKIWRNSLETGEPYNIEYRLRHRSGEYRWTLGKALPIRDEDGRITRWFGSITEIHESKILADEREIIAQELNHRIKNIFFRW